MVRSNHMVNLDQTIEIEFTEKVNKPDGGVMIRAMVPGITNKWAMPLHLTPEQAEMLGDPVAGARFKAKLVQSALKDGKDGSWPSDFWYNVAIFEGVADERNIKKEPTVAPPAPKVAPPTQAPTFEERENAKTESIVGQSSTANAVKVTIALVKLGHVKPNVRDILDSVASFQPGLKDIAMGTYVDSPLVEKAKEIGAKVVDVKSKDEPLFVDEGGAWDYPEPKGLKTNADFLIYTQKCGWIQEDVQKWLDNSVPDNWIKNNKKTWREAARICKDKALEQGLEPPFDFRQEKK